MKYNIGEQYQGFRLEKQEEVLEINSTARIFTHEKTGASLLHLENDDSNKVFSIGFKTPPSDDTGVAHILEHSVLSGSKKFPTKEPFLELMKGSLNTFLNAMTYPDKTIYPFASKNEKDFMNIMDVYLDAVFHPNIYNTKEILMQEGWHYELQSPEVMITYNGVVYNEMKGVFSSPENVLMEKINSSLFSNCYGFVSGGDPEAIPNLTQQQFIDFHSKYYHPSNSYIFLYGDGNLDNMLKFINENYLADYDKKEVDSQILPETSFDNMKESREEYAISEEDDEAEKTLLALSFVTGEATDAELNLGLTILQYILLGTEAGPLRRALLDAELGRDVSGSFDNSKLQPVFSIILNYSDEDKKDEFKKVVFESLKNLVDQGIDKKLIEACANSMEFSLREGNSGSMPKGLMYYLEAMNGWLYGGDPLSQIRYERIIAKIKENINENYFEKLIQKYLLNNSHASFIVLAPKKGLANVRSMQICDKLQKYKDGLSSSEIQQIIDENNNLINRQMTPDSEEVLKTIPLLALEDIDRKTKQLNIKQMDVDGVKLLHHDVFTSKIAYLNFMFDTKILDEEDIPYVSLLANLLGMLSTKNYDYSDLSNEILANTGGIYFASKVYGNSKDEMKYISYCEAHCKVILDKMPKSIELLSEIIGNTILTDKKRIRERIRVLIANNQNNLIRNGHQTAMLRVASYFSPSSAHVDKTSGYGFYNFIMEIENNFDEKIDEVIVKLETIMKKLFNINSLTVAITGQSEEVEALKQSISGILNVLSSNQVTIRENTFAEEAKNEGMLTPSNVQYVAKGYNYKKLGYDYTGKLLVLKTILSKDYLWNRVRVQGGAYGAMVSMNIIGNLIFASYRDPNLNDTLNTYDEASKYVENFTATDREMLKYIIGTISELDAPMTLEMEGATALGYFLSRVSQEDRELERKEVLTTTKEDIVNFKNLIEDVMGKNFIAVLGNDNKIKSEVKVFKNLINIF